MRILSIDFLLAILNFRSSNQFLSLGGTSPQNPPSDNDAASKPTFQHNATAFALNGPSALPVFRTQLDTRPYPLQARVDLVNYPFDKQVPTEVDWMY